MKIYRVIVSTGIVFWCANATKANEEGKICAIKQMAMTGEPVTFTVDPVVVPLLKPDFLIWMNENYGGYQNV
jgi:hypothetical protein